LARCAIPAALIGALCGPAALIGALCELPALIGAPCELAALIGPRDARVQFEWPLASQRGS